MKIEQKNGYTIIDRRGPEPCRVCGASDAHSLSYGQPTMACILYLRQQVSDLKNDCVQLESKLQKCEEEVNRLKGEVNELCGGRYEFM